MTFPEVPFARLHHLELVHSRYTEPVSLLRRLGAVQGQDFAWSKWALGVRIPGSTLQAIEGALDEGRILRTHVLRPTWQLVAAEDIHWLLELTAPQIRTSLRSRHRELEITPEMVSKSNRILEKSLRDGQFHFRDDIVQKWAEAGIVDDNNRAAHLLMLAELEGLIASGPVKGNKTTYALLEERVPKPPSFPREEALGRLAKIYLQTRWPATVHDFAWWSGLSVTDARHAFNLNTPAFVAEIIGGKTYWIDAGEPFFKTPEPTAFLLPAYDEYLISYKDREASVTFDDHSKAVSVNGIFYPTVIIDGKVTGIWKRVVQKHQVRLDFQFFRPHSEAELDALENAASGFRKFLLKDTDGQWH